MNPETLPIKILHLEDIPFDMEMVARELHKSGLHCHIQTASDKASFENLLVNWQPDIILSDHSLPSFNSIGALKVVEEKAAGTPVILVTATVSEEFAVEILRKGAADYILKTNLRRLPSAITNALEKTRAIKEKDDAESELKRSYFQLRKLASHLQEIREEERAAMAREIHDELGQLLTAIKLDVSWLSLKVEEELLKNKITGINELTADALKTVRKLATELHPAILDKLGIIEAIRWQSSEFSKRTGIPVTASLPEEISLNAKASIALFRIYQESLNNISKHAEATQVHCSLHKQNGRILLLISDNGKGFEEEAVKIKQTLGLLSMQERAIMLGGTLEIKSKPGKGTVLQVNFPAPDNP